MSATRPTEHVREVTERLREEDLLDYVGAICPVCNLAYFVAVGSDWGVCGDCFGEALERVPADSFA